MIIACPNCGETDDLSGVDSPDGIRIRCGQCDESWLRDAAPRTCATCGGTQIEERTRALTQYSRGTQLSIVGLGSIWLCRVCDRKMFEWSEQGRPIPFAYRSSALNACAADDREDGDDVLVTP